MRALYFHKKENHKVKCELCPHYCLINEGDYGICKVRKNVRGELIAKNYGLVSSIGFDPIEKKPLYHFYPGSKILSVGSLGCNLKCQFCQNWQISQSSIEGYKRDIERMDSDKIVQLALSNDNNIGIAYTYNEPTVFYEFMFDIAQKAKENNLKNVMVTNAYINKEPLDRLNSVIDAYSVDLKAFNNDFFINYTKSTLEPVKETLLNIVKAGKHLEITNLVIPDLNDNIREFEQMVKWIKENLGESIVLHISKYYPNYKLTAGQTSIEKMLELNQIAKEYLKYVYLGNVLLEEGNNSYCPICNELLISRMAYMVQKHSIDETGACIKCGKKVFNYLN